MSQDPNSNDPHSSCSLASQVENHFQREVRNDPEVKDPSQSKRPKLDPEAPATEVKDNNQKDDGFFRKLVEELECGICCEIMH